MIKQANELFQQGKLQQAEQLYRQLLQANSTNIDAMWGLGKVAFAFDSYQHAYNIFKKCVSLRPNVYVLWQSLAQACERLMRFDEAEGALVKANDLSGATLSTLFPLAVFYCQSGNIDSAKLLLKQIDTLHAENVRSFCLKVRINIITHFDDSANVMLTHLKNSATAYSNNEKVLLHYAFAKLFQQQGEHQVAFEHFSQANQLQHNESNFCVNDMHAHFEQLINSFNDDFFNNCLEKPTAGEAITIPLTPIFIVGQPRSGSTLLEQMLIGHSEISTGGELPFIAGDIAQGVHQITQQYFPQGAVALAKPEYKRQRAELGAHYLASLQTMAPQARYIIDKMPANYQSIGLIRLLMPHAKIIHITRDALDVSWSIFSNHFESTEPYFCSLNEIGKYHQQYQKIMDHWQQNTANFIHTICYQDLIAQPQHEISQVLKFCGLSYQESCLTFAEQKRHIATLSDVQLRQGIRSENSSAWLPYKNQLSGLIEQFKSI